GRGAVGHVDEHVGQGVRAVGRVDDAADAGRGRPQAGDLLGAEPGAGRRPALVARAASATGLAGGADPAVDDLVAAVALRAAPGPDVCAGLGRAGRRPALVVRAAAAAGLTGGTGSAVEHAPAAVARRAAGVAERGAGRDHAGPRVAVAALAE